jgi:tetratricopeptide (TPR) repeat protein
MTDGAGDPAADLTRAEVWISRGDELSAVGRYEEAAASYARGVKISGASGGAVSVRAALKHSASLVKLDHFAQARVAFDALRRKLDDATDPRRAAERLDAAIAHTLIGRAEELCRARRYDTAVVALNALLSELGDARNTTTARARSNARLIKADALFALGRQSDALAALREAVDEFSNLEMAHRNVPGASIALNRLAPLLAQKGEIALALTLCELGLASEPPPTDPGFEPVIVAAAASATRFIEEGRAEAAIEVMTRLLRLIEQMPPKLGALVGDSLYRLSLELRRANQPERAAAFWNDVIEACGASTMPILRTFVVRAMVERAELLTLLGQPYEAISLGTTCVAHFDPELATANPMLLARAIGTKGTALAAEGRYDEAVEVFDALIARFRHMSSPALRGQLARAFENKAMALDALGRATDAAEVRREMALNCGDVAIDAFDQSAKQFDGLDDGQVAAAMYSKATVLTELGRIGEATVSLDALIARFDPDDSEPKVLEAIRRARVLREKIDLQAS